MCYVLCCLAPFLMGQDCTYDPTGTTGGAGNDPGIPPSIPAPLPMANVSTLRVFREGTKDLTAYAELKTDGSGLIARKYTANNHVLEVGHDPSTPPRYAIAWIRFDLSAMPTNPDRVFLAFCTEPGQAQKNSTIFVDLLTSSWDSSTTNNWPSWSTFLYLYEANAAPWSFIEITELYQKWVNGSQPNFGFQLWAFNNLGPTGSKVWNTLCSSEYFDESLRPALITEGVDPAPPRFVFPLAGKYSPERITGYKFGDPWLGQHCLVNQDVPLLHSGIDCSARVGDSVFAAERGVVKYASSFGDGLGNVVVIQHEDEDRSVVFHSIYGHIDPSNWVVLGAKVEKSDKIGVVAEISLGAHLHFGIRHGAYEPVWSIRGRLPKQACATEKYPDGLELAFPGNFSDPKQMLWEE